MDESIRGLSKFGWSLFKVDNIMEEIIYVMDGCTKMYDFFDMFIGNTDRIYLSYNDIGWVMVNFLYL